VSAISISPSSEQVSVTTHCQQIPILIQNLEEFLMAILFLSREQARRSLCHLCPLKESYDFTFGRYIPL
jgi:hypothetical protein